MSDTPTHGSDEQIITEPLGTVDVTLTLREGDLDEVEAAFEQSGAEDLTSFVLNNCQTGSEVLTVDDE